MKNIPLTIQTRNYGNINTRIVLNSPGQPFYHEASYPYSSANEYCMLIIRRSDLQIMTSITFTDNSTVPAGISPFLGNSEYMYVLTTNALSTSNLPTGALYTWLINEGAGVGLRKLEQFFAALNCSNWANFSYTLVDIFGNDQSGNTIEMINTTESASLLALELQPISYAGHTIYSPVNLQ